MTTLSEDAAAAAEQPSEVLPGAASQEWARRARDAAARARVAQAWVAGRVRRAASRISAGALEKTAGARGAASPMDYRPMSIRQLLAFIKGGSKASGENRPPFLEAAHDFYMRWVAIPGTVILNVPQWLIQRPYRAAIAAVIGVILYGN